jgi:CHAT domain-containing protein
VGAIARTNLAELFNDRAQFDRALREATAALKWLDPAGQADAAWQARCELARALAGKGRVAEAQREFDQAMELVEGLRAHIGAEGSRRSFSAAKQRLYRSAFAVLSSAGKPAAAFAVSERARGRAFLDMLAERRVHLGDPETQDRLGPARDRMLQALPPLRLGLDGLAPTGAPARKQPDRVRLAADPAQGWLSLVIVNPARIEQIQRVLGPREGLVSFFHDGQRLHVFLITKQALEQTSAEVDERGLGLRVSDLLRSLRHPDRSDRKVRRKSGRLFELTLGPLGARLAGLKRLTVVPWGPLHYVPFGVLWDGQGYLVDSHEISVVPSASVLVMVRSGQPHRQPLGSAEVLAMGNPATELQSLPAAEREAELVGKLFAKATVFKRDAATKQAFLERAEQAGLIHLASHGVFLPDRPMESYLALAGGGAGRGHLAALEVLGLDLARARLVMLSACSSGEVQVDQGDEIIGLSRAFLHAGTPALIAGLWPLADESAQELVGRLYAGLKQGQSPTAALTLAKRELKRDERFGHPFYWAPYELIGS